MSGLRSNKLFFAHTRRESSGIIFLIKPKNIIGGNVVDYSYSEYSMDAVYEWEEEMNETANGNVTFIGIISFRVTRTVKKSGSLTLAVTFCQKKYYYFSNKTERELCRLPLPTSQRESVNKSYIKKARFDLYIYPGF